MKCGGGKKLHLLGKHCTWYQGNMLLSVGTRKSGSKISMQKGSFKGGKAKNYASVQEEGIPVAFIRFKTKNLEF
eukprot:scaffold99952_cov19-Tisochrysis_lutea.AAC.1